MWVKEGLDLCLPEPSGVEYFIDYMRPEGLGWFSHDAMGGASPHSWSEISAFSRGTDLRLEPWEASQIRAMSVAYVQERARGSEPMKVSPAFEDRPDDDPGIAVERRRVSEQLKQSFGAMAGNR